MKKLFYIFYLPFLLLSCQRLEENKDVHMAEVSFSHLSLQQFNTTNEQARTQASGWEHILAEEAELVITNNESGETFTLAFNPNDFFLPKTIMLPYGEYSYRADSEGGDFSEFLPFTVAGSINLSARNINTVLNGETSYGLITIKNAYINRISLSGEEMILTDDGGYFYIYTNSGEPIQLEIESDEGQLIERALTVEAYSHKSYFLTPEFGNTNLLSLQLGDFEYSIEGIALNDIRNVLYDQDGNRYRTVTIGEQVWMAENLRSTTFCNGDPIPHVPGVAEDWADADEPMWTYYDNHEGNNIPYGKLYNGLVALDERNPCPCGWKVPSKEDYDQLAEYAAQYDESRGNLKEVGYDHWISPNGSATNTTGFSLIGAGLFAPRLAGERGAGIHNTYSFPALEIGFNYLHLSSNVWTSTIGYRTPEENRNNFPEESLYIFFTSYRQHVVPHWPGTVLHDGTIEEGLSIRCIKEEDGL